MNLKQFTRDLSPSVKTYSLATGGSIEAGLVVIVYNTGRKYRDCDKAEAVRRFIKEFGVELEQPDMYLVGYFADGVTTLAIGERFADTREGLISAMKNLNESVWDQSSHRYFRLPKHKNEKDILDDTMIGKVRMLESRIENKRFWYRRLWK